MPRKGKTKHLVNRPKVKDYEKEGDRESLSNFKFRLLKKKYKIVVPPKHKLVNREVDTVDTLFDLDNQIDLTKTNGDFSDYYRKYIKRKKRPYKVRDRRTLNHMVHRIFKGIRDSFFEEPDGVALEGLGYLCVWEEPRDVALFKENGFGGISKRKMLRPTLYTQFQDDDMLDCWTMDYGFSRIVTDKITQQIEEGKVFQLHPYLARQFLRKSVDWLSMGIQEPKKGNVAWKEYKKSLVGSDFEIKDILLESKKGKK